MKILITFQHSKGLVTVLTRQFDNELPDLETAEKYLNSEGYEQVRILAIVEDKLVTWPGETRL